MGKYKNIFKFAFLPVVALVSVFAHEMRAHGQATCNAGTASVTCYNMTFADSCGESGACSGTLATGSCAPSPTSSPPPASPSPSASPTLLAGMCTSVPNGITINTSGNVTVNCPGGYPFPINGGCDSSGRDNIDFIDTSGTQTCHQNGGTNLTTAYINCCKVSIPATQYSGSGNPFASVACSGSNPTSINGGCSSGGRLNIDYISLGGNVQSCNDNGGSGITATINCSAITLSGCVQNSATNSSGNLLTISCTAGLTALNGGCSGPGRINTNYISGNTQFCHQNAGGGNALTAWITCCN